MVDIKKYEGKNIRIKTDNEIIEGILTTVGEFDINANTEYGGFIPNASFYNLDGKLLTANLHYIFGESQIKIEPEIIN